MPEESAKLDQTTTAPETDTATATGEQTAEEIKLTSAALKARMDRHHRATIKAQFGVDDPAALKAQLDELASIKAEQVKAKEAQMSELERYKRDIELAKGEHAKARAELERVAFESRVIRECAKLGIQDIEYASYAFNRASAGSEDALDIGAWLADESKKRPAAFGLATAMAPATTAPGKANAQAQPPRAGAMDEIDATKMTNEQFKSRFGVSVRRS